MIWEFGAPLYCIKIEIVDQNLKRHCLHIHKKPKLTDKDIPVTTYFLNTKKRKVCGQDSDDTNTECQQSIIESCEIEIENTELTKEFQALIFGDTNSHSCINTEKLDEILERVRSIQISVDQNKTPLTLPPLAKPKDVKSSDERLK